MVAVAFGTLGLSRRGIGVSACVSAASTSAEIRQERPVAERVVRSRVSTARIALEVTKDSQAGTAAAGAAQKGYGRPERRPFVSDRGNAGQTKRFT